MSTATIAAPAGDTATLTLPRLLGLLALRLVLFAGFQGLIALALLASGVDDPWRASAAWWPLAAVAANLVNLGVLSRALRREGSGLLELYRPARGTWKRDVLLALGVTLVAAPLAAGPNILLATALFGDPQIALDLFVQPLPMWAAIVAVVLFPITTAAAELPMYYGYLQPRLAAVVRAGWLVLLLPAVFHALQHAALPLIFDPAFLLWRAVMFLPFAILLALALRWRPSLLPYLLVVHFLLDLQAALMVLAAAG